MGKRRQRQMDIETRHTTPNTENVYPMSAGAAYELARFRARNPQQQAFFDSISDNPVSIGLGAAGTGKTFVAIAAAFDLQRRGVVDKLVFSRPIVEVGEKIGAIPGDLGDKMNPWMMPLFDALLEFVDGRTLKRELANKRIEILPLGYIRGRSIKRAALILDEAQNADAKSITAFLTRIDQGSRVVLTGDPDQTDLYRRSGLAPVAEALAGLDGVGITSFSRDTIVRHAMIGPMLDRLDGIGIPART